MLVRLPELWVTMAVRPLEKSVAEDAQFAWTPAGIAPYSAEKANLARDETLLRLIAARSGGRYADIADFSELLDAIVERQKNFAGPQPQVKTYRLFNFGALFALFVSLLTAEWMLRRRWQLH